MSLDKNLISIFENITSKAALASYKLVGKKDTLCARKTMFNSHITEQFLPLERDLFSQLGEDSVKNKAWIRVLSVELTLKNIKFLINTGKTMLWLNQ